MNAAAGKREREVRSTFLWPQVQLELLPKLPFKINELNKQSDMSGRRTARQQQTTTHSSSNSNTGTATRAATTHINNQANGKVSSTVRVTYVWLCVLCVCVYVFVCVFVCVCVCSVCFNYQLKRPMLIMFEILDLLALPALPALSLSLPTSLCLSLSHSLSHSPSASIFHFLSRSPFLPFPLSCSVLLSSCQQQRAQVKSVCCSAANLAFLPSNLVSFDS